VFVATLRVAFGWGALTGRFVCRERYCALRLPRLCARMPESRKAGPTPTDPTFRGTRLGARVTHREALTHPTGRGVSRVRCLDGDVT